MKLIELLSVTIRIFGILLVVHCLRVFPSWLTEIKQLKENSTYSVDPGISMNLYYFSAIAILLIAIIMIVLPVSIAKILATKSSSNSPLLEEKGEAIQIAGFTIIGVYILTWAIPDLLLNALVIFELKMYTPSDSLGLTQAVHSEIVTLVEIGIGLYLTLSAQGVTKLIRKFRER